MKFIYRYNRAQTRQQAYENVLKGIASKELTVLQEIENEIRVVIDGGYMPKYAEQILELIEHSTDHPTAEDVYQTLRQSNSKIVLATVYNNLNTLCKQGKIRKVSTGSGSERYDKTFRHDHLICSRCGRISDVTLHDLKAQIEDELGFSIGSYDLRIHHVCNACNKGAKEAS